MNSHCTNNNKHSGSRTRKRRRGHGLIGLVCFSLCVNATKGFESQLPTTTRQPLAPVAGRSASHLPAMPSSPFSETHAAEGRQTKSNPRSPAVLTPTEEKELLRQAVEYRRISELEKELALRHHNFLPMLSVRAESAGYGEELDAYEDAKYEGQLAREKLVTHNMQLVRYCVDQIIGKETAFESGSGSTKGLPLNSLSREDLVQEGAIGLARAVDKWNPEIGGRFSTYAVYWVRAAVLRCIAERDDVVRVPGHVSQAIVKINKAAKRLGWVLQESGGILVTEHGKGSKSVVSGAACESPSWRAARAAKCLAEEAGLSEQHFEEAMRARRRRYSGGYVPVEQWMESSGRSGAGGYHTDENEDQDRTRMESEAANEDIRTVLSRHLRPKEMEALSWRYGLFGDEQPAERANRQLLEMEDRLFGPSAVEAAPGAKPASAAPAKGGRWGEAMTFVEVGKKMQVSAEYTRRLCHGALDKLRRAAEEGTLEPAFLC
ncbi:unnamed protein product [Pseudo-nitzschia multistriata]|uniref:RNA polymerase sigma-70 domain-containing protein n=1 Tax=Pseudo-nitzschia multistriata TaxID=183589 RepID=A0A448ZGT6_9STRA|nr:unnamed protein product [Pseudo-nitzschia multistriata]